LNYDPEKLKSENLAIFFLKVNIYF
jgi:hypothetical protein